MRSSSVTTVAVLITAAVLLFARGATAQSPAGDWGARVGMSLRAAWHGSRHPGAATMLSSVKPETGRANVFVLFDGEPTAVPGFRMVSQSGSVATGVLELEALPRLASLSNVRYISAERVFYPTDDPGVISVRAPRTRTRLGVTGKGVLLGIIDTGIDWTHPDFLDSEGNTRIEAILDFSEPPDSLGPGDLGEPGLYGGIVVSREMIDAALGGRGNIRQKDYMGHGTHVAGTAAASPSGDTLNSLGGVAPGVSIVAIKVSRTPRDSSLSDGNIANGVLFLDSLAWSRGMPYVANLSLGGVLGSHDGTSLFEQYLEGFLDESHRGRAIVVSSGNSRGSRAHASGDFLSTGPDSTVLELNLTGAQADEDYAHVQIWLSKNHRGVDVEILSPGGIATAWIDDGDTLMAVTDAGVIIGENAFGGVHSLAGDRLISIILADKGATDLDTSNIDAQLATGAWRFVMRPSEGTMYSSGDAWDAYVYSNNGTGARFASHVDETGTVNEPGTAEGVITTGAYNVRTGWWSLDGGAGSLGVGLGGTTPGELTYFTSLGPTRDGRLKPEITAPGRWVLSSLSSDAWPLTEPLSIFSLSGSLPLLLVASDSVHGVSQGTSFSAPHVAGVVALLLEADSTLTSAEIKTLITSTAALDSQTVGAPDNYWGYGRVNAAGAVAKALGSPSGPVLLSAALNPPDTLAADSLRYRVSVDFSASLQALAGCRLRITWPPDVLRLHGAPDTLSADGALWLDAKLDSLSLGVLNLNASATVFAPDRYGLVSLAFRPVKPIDADSVLVGCEVLSISGDLGGEDLLGALSVTQAGPLSVRLEGVCLVAGDLDGNGALDIFDLLEMLKVISGKREENLCSDLDGSGGTDIFDLLVQLGELGRK